MWWGGMTVVGRSRSGYHAWSSGGRDRRTDRDQQLVPKIKAAFDASGQTYGYPRVIAPNRLAEIETITAVNQVWQADITDVATDEGWLYLAIVIDAFSRRILGWAFSPTLETESVVTALLLAVQHRGRPPKEIVFHSDRGVQYASAQFRAHLDRLGFLPSMSRRGNCYDNA